MSAFSQVCYPHRYLAQPHDMSTGLRRSQSQHAFKDDTSGSELQCWGVSNDVWQAVY